MSVRPFTGKYLDNKMKGSYSCVVCSDGDGNDDGMCVCLCVCLRVSVRPFTGKYLDNKMKGSYSCVVCGAGLFSSSDKFESGCGWPAFSQVLSSAAVSLTADHSHGLSVCRLQLIISN